MGYVETLQATPNGGPKNFHEWVVKTFGPGNSQTLHASLQRKVLETGSADDHGRLGQLVDSQSRPLDEVVNGALGLTNKGMGYNPRFIYPKTGGIECLPWPWPDP